MGKRELLQPQLQHKPRVRCSAHWFFAVITLVLAVVLLAFAAVLPNWLLYHRSAKYFSTTSQVSISDIHPYGDQYESMKQSLLNTIQYESTLSGQEWSVADFSEANSIADESDEEGKNNSVISDALSRFDQFLAAWNTSLEEEDHWVSGLEMMGYDNIVPISSQDTSQPDILMINATDYSNINATLRASELLLDCSTGAPAYMHLALFSWDDPDPELLWNGLMSAYRSQLGIQFTEVSSNNQAVQFSALSADQVFRLDALIQMEYGSSIVYEIQVELTAEK